MSVSVRQRQRCRASRFSVEVLEDRQLLALAFDYAMAERFGRDLNNNGLIDEPNTATYAQPKTLTLTFTVSGDVNPPTSTIYRWSMQPSGGGAPTVVQRTVAQIGAGNLPTVSVPAGVYSTTFQRIAGGSVTNTIVQPVSARDILIVSMGDSYSSGEGNPERVQGLSLPSAFSSDTVSYLQNSDLNDFFPAATFTAASPFFTQTKVAQWADGADGLYGPTPFGLNMTNDNRQSHRSTLAAPAQYALALERSDPHTSVTFVHIAQSGATTQTAIGKVKAFGFENPNYVLTPQTKLLPAIVGQRPVDQLLMSLGANDVMFKDLAIGLVLSDIVVDDPIGTAGLFPPSGVNQIYQQANSVIAQSKALQGVLFGFNVLAAGLPADYASVQQALAATGVTIRAKMIMEYPDPTRIFQSFINPNNGQPFTLPWWGPAIFDIVPGVEVSATESYFVSNQILTPLNKAVAAGAAANGWTYLAGISSAFMGHGYDAPRVQDSLGNLRFLRTARESSLYQGPVGLTGPGSTSGTLHPNALGHQAIKAVILNDLTPRVPVVTSTRGRFVVARVGKAGSHVRNSGLTFQWDFDRLPGRGRFVADAAGARAAITGVDPDPRTPGRVATLRITNALGLSTERAVLLPGRAVRGPLHGHGHHA